VEGGGAIVVIGRKLAPILINPALTECTGRVKMQPFFARVFQKVETNGKSGEFKRAIAMVNI
jgi:hypothetical protein